MKRYARSWREQEWKKSTEDVADFSNVVILYKRVRIQKYNPKIKFRIFIMDHLYDKLKMVGPDKKLLN